MKTLQNFSILFLLVAFSQGYSQAAYPILPSAEAHYAELLNYDPQPTEEGRWLDSIAFPKELFNDALLYTMITPAYLSAEEVARLKNSVSFPANSSEQTRKELDFLLRLQEQRTPQQVLQVNELGKVGYWPEIDLLPSHPQYQQNLEYLFYEVQQVMGAEYNASNSPHTARLLKGVMRDMRLVEFSLKYHHLRARPYQLDLRLEPLNRMKSPSFASGHTLWAYVQALSLAELIPEKSVAFLELAWQIGYSRELMGVHFPSDEEAARKLAYEMLQLMWQKEDFRRDLEMAKSEWKERI